jgi:hypothetical protein
MKAIHILFKEFKMNVLLEYADMLFMYALQKNRIRGRSRKSWYRKHIFIL